MNFEKWMELVDAAINVKSFGSGITHLDLCDWLYYDAFEDGCTPEDAAQSALQNDDVYSSIFKEFMD